MEWRVWMNWLILFWFWYLQLLLVDQQENYSPDTDNTPIQTYINKIKNRVIFKTKSRHSLELLSSKNYGITWKNYKMIIKDKNSEDVPHLDITEVVLVHCILLNGTYQHDFNNFTYMHIK